MTDITRHPEAVALLAAVCDEPDDDTPRLVYADWLDDHGDEVWRARAAFIREQVRLAAGQPRPDTPGWQPADTLLFRHHEAWAQEHPAWLGPYRDGYDFPDYRRGFVDGVRVGFDRWLSGAGETRLIVPITRLEVWRADLTRVAEVPQFATVRELSLQLEPPATAEQVAVFVGSPAVRQLRSLSIGRGVGGPAVPVLVRAANLARLAALRSGGGADMIAAVEPGSALVGLTDLALWGEGLGNDGLVRLADAPGLARLTRLACQHTAVGDAGLIALARSPRAANLRSLLLWTPDLGEAGARAVAESPHLGNLTELRLSRSRLSRRFEAIVRRRFPFVEFK